MQNDAPTLDPVPETPSSRNPTAQRFHEIGVPTGATLVGVLLAAVVIDQLFGRNVGSVIGAVAVAAISLVLLASGSLESRASKVLVGLAPAFGLWLAIRASTPIITFNVLAILALWVLGTGLSRRGRFFDLRFMSLIGSSVGVIEDAVFAVPYGAQGASRTIVGADKSRWRDVASGVFVASPVLIIVAALLAQADEQFSTLFGWLFTSALFKHPLGIAAGAAFVLMLVRRSNNHFEDVPIHGSKMFTPITSLTIVLCFVGLYGAFVAAQFADVLQTTFTKTEIRDYARSGFFQLLGVSTITLAVLMFVPSVTQDAHEEIRKKLRWASTAAVGLTLVITAMAARRLVLFVQIHQMTVLRYLCLVAATAIAVIFVLLAVRLWGVRADRDWFVGATLSVLLVAVLSLNVMNPEAFVARYNLAGATEARGIDVAYLGNLSADAVPTIAAAADTLPNDQRRQLVTRICRRHHGNDDRRGFDANRSISVARAKLHELCRS